MSFTQVQEFNDTFGVRTRVTNGAPEDLHAEVRVREAKLRFELIREEFEELSKAYDEVDIVEVADALGDIRYVVIGAAQVFGLTHKVHDLYKSNTESYEGSLLSAEIQKEILQLLRLGILRNDHEGVATVLATMLQLVDQAAEFLHLYLPDIVTAIHKSNMSKLTADGKVVRRPEDNKVLKGELYKTPTAEIEYLLGFEGPENVDSE